MDHPEDSIDRAAALAARADAGFAAIHHRRSVEMQCRAGCSACCRARLAITRVEEAFLRRGLASLPGERRAEIAARTREDGREMCPALDDDGRCGVYPFRPLICRTYGAPLRHRSAVPMVRPPLVDVCDLNFVGIAPASLPPEDVIEQTSLVEQLDEIDLEYCESNDLPAGERIPIASILR